MQRNSSESPRLKRSEQRWLDNPTMVMWQTISIYTMMFVQRCGQHWIQRLRRNIKKWQMKSMHVQWSLPVSVRFISASFMSVIDRYLLSPLRNQSLIDQATTLLERIIGFGPGQLGKVAWIAHCMYEDADGKFCGVKWVASCTCLYNVNRFHAVSKFIQSQNHGQPSLTMIWIWRSILMLLSSGLLVDLKVCTVLTFWAIPESDISHR